MTIPRKGTPEQLAGAREKHRRHTKAWRDKNRARIAAYRKKNRKKRNAYCRDYYQRIIKPKANAARALGAELESLRKQRDELQAANTREVERRRKAEATLDDVLHSSFCTKCGWRGVPEPRNPLGRAWWCGNPNCGYEVPEPKAAIIERLGEEKAFYERTIEQLTRSVHAVKDADIRALRSQLDKSVRPLQKAAAVFAVFDRCPICEPGNPCGEADIYENGVWKSKGRRIHRAGCFVARFNPETTIERAG